MENGKSPGIDGIPIEFYKEFIEIIKKVLQKTFNEILFTNKITPKTWNQAIITLIPRRVAEGGATGANEPALRKLCPLYLCPKK